MTPVTIAIATYNRAEELRRTLATLAPACRAAGGAWEVLVVGNCCTDHTADVVCEMAPAFDGKLRCVDERRQGLSFARNRAIDEARYDVVAFLDDDVDVEPQWLAALSAAYAGGERAAVGGKARLVYLGARPAWLGPREEGYLTKVDHGPEARPARPDELFGVNVSFDRRWARRAGLFRTDLGRCGKTLAGDEEVDLLERLAAAGGALWYEPAAAVGHRVPPERLRRAWFWRRCFDGHRCTVRRWDTRDATADALARAAWRLGLAGWALVVGTLRFGPSSEEWFHRSAVLAGRAGALVGLVARLTQFSSREIQEHVPATLPAGVTR